MIMNVKNVAFFFETFHAMSAEPLVNCPECHEPKLIKLIGAGAAVIIRGTETPCRGSRGGGKTIKGTEKHKDQQAWWREGPVDKSVLKNPEKYIQEG